MRIFSVRRLNLFNIRQWKERYWSPFKWLHNKYVDLCTKHTCDNYILHLPVAYIICNSLFCYIRNIYISGIHWVSLHETLYNMHYFGRFYVISSIIRLATWSSFTPYVSCRKHGQMHPNSALKTVLLFFVGDGWFKWKNNVKFQEF